MMIVWLLVSVVSADLCPAYRCGDDHEYEEHQCSFFANNTYFLRECSSGSSCNFTKNLGNSTCEQDHKGIIYSYPGEPCTAKHHPCLYGSCSQGYCLAQQSGEDCTLSEMCMPGLRCYKGKCKALLQVGSTGCKDEFDCVVSAGCNFKTCVQYFSLSSGSSIENCNKYTSFLCSSGACANGVCVDAPKSEYYPPVKCKSSYECVSIGDNGMIYYGNCTCGYNSEAQSYCTLFPGDDLYQNFVLSTANWLLSEISDRCNTMRRYDKYCIDSFWDEPNTQELEIFAYWQANFTLLQKNPECVKETLTNDYWSIVEDVDLAWLLQLSLIAFLF